MNIQPQTPSRRVYKVTNITLDVDSIPTNVDDNDWWQIRVRSRDEMMSRQYRDALLAHLTRRSPQVQIDVEFYAGLNPTFYMKSTKSGEVYVNGYGQRN